MRLAMGLTIIGAALIIAGLLLMLVGEIMRLKPAHGGFGLVRAGEIAAICGLASGVALLIVLTVGPADRAGRGRRGQARAAGPAPAGGAAEEWLSPLRGPGAGLAPPRAATLPPVLVPEPEPTPAGPAPGYADDGWQPPAGEGWSPGPVYVWQPGGPDWDHAAREDWSPDGQDAWTQDEWYERDDWAPDDGQSGWADGGQEGWGDGGQEAWEPEARQAGGWEPGVAAGWDRAGDDWGPGAAAQDVGGWPAQGQWRPDAQPADDPQAPYLAGPEPGPLAGPEPGPLAGPVAGHLVGPEAAYLAGPPPAPGPRPDEPAPLPDGLPGGQRSPGRGRRPDGEYRPGHAEPPSPDTQEKIEQIKDLYLTAEAIGEEALVKHFDQLEKRQRSLIREFFEKAGLGSMHPGRDAARDPAGGPARGRADAAAEPGARDGASLPR